MSNEPLTFEIVWAALMENREQMKETDRRMKETGQQIKETDRIIQAMAQEFREQKEEADQQMKETREQLREQMKETNQQIGKLGNRFGELIEHLVVPGIVDKFNELGYRLTRHAESVKFHDPVTLKIVTEVDILLENGDAVIAVEVKSKLHTEGVNEHLERMAALRRLADFRGDSRKYRGAVAGAVIAGSAREYAHKSGFYVLEQAGDTMKLEIPPGFMPKDW